MVRRFSFWVYNLKKPKMLIGKTVCTPKFIALQGYKKCHTHHCLQVFTLHQESTNYDPQPDPAQHLFL